MNFTYFKGISLYGIAWLALGSRLLLKGIYIFDEIHLKQEVLDSNLYYYLVGALVLGLVKGKFILKKSADRIIRHIVQFEEPLKWKQIFPKSFYFFMTIMMCFGIAIKFLPIDLVVKGSIDIFVGSALITGALYFFKKAWMIKMSLDDL